MAINTNIEDKEYEGKTETYLQLLHHHRHYYIIAGFTGLLKYQYYLW
ncbi:MAG TPA: hypothetical protein VFC05_04450 [Nitrososphaeraceae archaeon]|nr:hypothetical protein [Nitrososphaeraceae archaeon]